MQDGLDGTKWSTNLFSSCKVALLPLDPLDTWEDLIKRMESQSQCPRFLVKPFDCSVPSGILCGLWWKIQSTPYVTTCFYHHRSRRKLADFPSNSWRFLVILDFCCCIVLYPSTTRVFTTGQTDPPQHLRLPAPPGGTPLNNMSAGMTIPNVWKNETKKEKVPNHQPVLICFNDM